MSTEITPRREPLLRPLLDYTLNFPDQPPPLINEDFPFDLFIETRDGRILLVNRLGDPNFGNWGGIWCQALPDEPDKPPMCQIFNESMENAAPFPQTQRQWNYRAHCYMTTYYWTDFMRTRCVEMMKIWPVNDMPEWVPNLRERWVIVNKARKENAEEVEAFLQELEQEEDEESLQAAREMRQIFARRLSERPLWKQRRQDELVARKRAEEKEFASIRAAAAEYDQRQKKFREKEDRERAWVAERMRLEGARLQGERLQSSQELLEEPLQPANNQEQRPSSVDTLSSATFDNSTMRHVDKDPIRATLSLSPVSPDVAVRLSIESLDTERSNETHDIAEQSLQVKKKVRETREGTKQQIAHMVSGGQRRLASLLCFGKKEDKRIVASKYFQPQEKTPIFLQR